MKFSKIIVGGMQGGRFMDRRSFLKVIGGTAAATALAGRLDEAVAALEGSAKEEGKPFPKRTLGKTGEKVSIIGFGGLSLRFEEQPGVNESVAFAIDRGINYFDVAPAYGDAEEKMGIALQGKRNKVFLSCKTGRRDKEGARLELERSLKRLKTDHFDLYQMHHIRTKEETEKALGPGGAMETFLEAKKKGQVRFLGFSAHTMKAALLAMEKFPFDTVMFPINFGEFLVTGFGPPVVRMASEKGMGIIAIKPMYAGLWPEGAKPPAPKWWYKPLFDREEIDLGLRFTLSQPGVTTAIPPSDVGLIRTAIEVAPDYRPLTDDDRKKLKEMAEGFISHFEGEEKQAVTHHRYWEDTPVAV
jgi:predicted aldo/keto reductase-like oxidoreductase